jgi:5-methylcytosine-specific restriction endonuclease McrBC GTP-binding regulatory subunit McrB
MNMYYGAEEQGSMGLPETAAWWWECQRANSEVREVAALVKLE